MAGKGAPETETLHVIAEHVRQLRDAVVREATPAYEAWLPGIRRRAFRAGAANLAAYVALRRHDLRALQERLMPFGLSSLGRCESRVMPTLDAVLHSASAIAGEGSPVPYPTANRFFRGQRLLQRMTAELFGAAPAHRHTRIMVTLPSEAASDYPLVRDLVQAGTNCVRINSAHDNAGAWVAMIDNVRRAASETGRPCRVLADLAGPKLRTTVVRPASADGRVHEGDTILLSADPEVPAPEGVSVVGCTIPEAIAQLLAGEPVWIDDGHIGCEVERAERGSVRLRVTSVRAGGEKLRPEKGLNFPKSSLDLAALTSDDLAALDVLAARVDVLGYSFVKEPDDVTQLAGEIAARRSSDRPAVGIILKIETAHAVSNLPYLIVRSASIHPTAVMIARGDLAVEIGYRRLAEMQEELLWLCEAASIPVVWATQVLDTFVKKGRGSRAEFTDAAMSERADCVMLNKGPYVVEAVRQLDDLIGRMEAHQTKKTSRLRALHSW